MIGLDPLVLRGGLGVLLIAYGTWKFTNLQKRDMMAAGGEGLTCDPYGDPFRSGAEPCVVDDLDLDDSAAAAATAVATAAALAAAEADGPDGGLDGGGGMVPLPVGWREGAMRRRQLMLATKALPFGLAAGFLGGAVAEPGPVAVVFGQFQSWSPQTTRAMLTRFFLPIQCVLLASYSSNGLLTDQVIMQAVAATPGVFAGVGLGTYLNRRIDSTAFTSAVTLIVIALGGLSLFSAVSGVD